MKFHFHWGGCDIWIALVKFHAFPNGRIRNTLLIQALQTLLIWVSTQNLYFLYTLRLLIQSQERSYLSPLAHINWNLLKFLKILHLLLYWDFQLVNSLSGEHLLEKNRASTLENDPSLKLYCVKAFPTLTPSESHYKGFPFLTAVAFTSLVLKKSRNPF